MTESTSGGGTAQQLEVEPPAALLSRRSKNVIFATILLGLLIAALDQTIVSTSLPSIVGDLGGGGHVSWVVTAYLLTQTIITIVAGKLGDIVGRKTVFQVSILVFIAGSVLCGVAQNLGWLVGARALQGLGGGGLTVTATALIGDVIPLRERGRYQGALGAVFGVTTVLGPLLGGYFTDDLSWRWDFFVNVPIGVVVVAIAARTIPSIGTAAKPVLDRAGIVFVSIGSAAVILATSWGGTTYGWASPTIIALFVVAAVGLTVFVLVEQRATEPILPMRLFRSQVFSVCCALSFLVGFAMLGSITFLPTFLQYVDGVSAIESGIRLLPLVAGLLVTTLVSGNLVSKTGKYKIFPVLGMPIMLVGFILLSRLHPQSSTLESSLYMVVIGAGIGFCMQVLTLVVQSTTSYADLGVATSGVTFMRTMGSAFGTAVFGALYSNFLANRLPGALAASPKVPSQATASPTDLHRFPAADIAAIVQAYAHSLDRVFLWGAPVAGAGFILALALKQVPLRGTERAAATDLGEAFAMPSAQNSEQRLERAVGQVLRNDRGRSFGEVVARSRSGMTDPQIWALLEVFLRQRVTPERRVAVSEVAMRHQLPPSVLHPVFDNLVAAGLASTDETGDFGLTDEGRTKVRMFSAALKQWLVEQLAGWEDPPDVEQVSRALDRIAVRLVEDVSERSLEQVDATAA